ncbi:DEAD/DEAH box helicase [bacterium]|nr:DEAD/DEAH box helicase [bacterium]
MIKFKDLKIDKLILDALIELGYETPTPIQEQAIPLVLEGHDLLGIAQTGTGKTAAFCLPILHILNQRKLKPSPKSPRVLVLTPTRELAIQIHDNLKTYGKYLPQKYAVIFGGVGQHKQVQSLGQGVEVLVATPGRLLDLSQQRLLKLDKVEIFVLDEADRMLDMGFMNDIKKIIPMLPSKRHNLFFSATMPSVIQALANKILECPKKVEVTPPATTVALIHQEVMYVDKLEKPALLEHLLKDKALKKVLVFVGMKHVANRVVEKLEKCGISSAAIHGNKAQGARQRAIENFAQGKVRVLVATDIASRGIDIDGITHVINYDLGNLAEAYVHRIGRTARAGSEGAAITFVTSEEKINLVNVERTTKQKIKVIVNQPFHSVTAEKAAAVAAPKVRSRGGRRPQSKKRQKRRLDR